MVAGWNGARYPPLLHNTINFEDYTFIILLYIPLYTIFIDTLGNPAQVNSAPPPDTNKFF